MRELIRMLIDVSYLTLIFTALIVGISGIIWVLFAL